MSATSTRLAIKEPDAAASGFGCLPPREWILSSAKRETFDSKVEGDARLTIDLVVERLALAYPDVRFFAVDSAFTCELLDVYRARLTDGNVSLFASLDELPLAAGGNRVLVGEAVVDGAEAGGVEVAEPRHLDRARPAREDQQAVMRGVPGEVHQDVDLVGGDLLGEPEVGPGGGVDEAR